MLQAGTACFKASKKHLDGLNHICRNCLRRDKHLNWVCIIDPKLTGKKRCLSCKAYKSISEYKRYSELGVSYRSRKCDGCRHKESQRLVKAGALVCADCKTSKPLHEFGRMKRSATGFNVRCKPCARLKGRKARARPSFIARQERTGQQRREYHRQYEKKWRQSLRSNTDRYTAKLVSSTRNRCKKNGWEFDLNESEIAEVIKRGVCEVTGLPFLIPQKGRSPWSPSLDRVEAGGGYVRRNVKVVVWAYNMAKGEWSEPEFNRLIDAILASRSTSVRPANEFSYQCEPEGRTLW